MSSLSGENNLRVSGRAVSAVLVRGTKRRVRASGKAGGGTPVEEEDDVVVGGRR